MPMGQERVPARAIREIKQRNNSKNNEKDSNVGRSCYDDCNECKRTEWL